MIRQPAPDYLPPEVLQRPDFARACMERDLGGIFEIAVKWGGPDITVSHLSRRCGMTIGQVQDYIKRGRQARLDTIDRVSDGLRIPGRMLRIVTRPWEAGTGEEKARPGADEGKCIPRLLVTSSGQGDSESEVLPDLMAWLTYSNTSDEAIAQIDSTRSYLAQAHARMSARTVLSEVLQVHEQAQTLLRSGKQRLRQTRALLEIDSDLLAHVCVLLGDLGNNRVASGYAFVALRMAQEAESSQAIAWSARSKTARWRGRYVESAEYARRGFEVSALTPTKVELAYREANSIALFGDAIRARQVLQRAEQTAAILPDSSDDSLSVWSFPIERQAIFSLSVAINTGDPDAALSAAEIADARWSEGSLKNSATWAQIRSGSAIAYMMKDSLDGAAEQIAPVLDLPQELRISTVTGYLKQLDSMLREPRFAKSNLAMGLSEKIHDFGLPRAVAECSGDV
jgi:hypothetical protein